jgi:flagellar export protein FliJ
MLHSPTPTATADFRLSSLLDWNQRQRDLRQLELSHMIQAEQRLQMDLRNLMGRIHELSDWQRRSLMAGPIDSEALIDHQRYQDKLHRELQELRQRDEQLQAERSQHEMAVQAAQQQVRMLETLRDQQAERFRRRVAHFEQRTQDDITSRQHHLRRRDIA